MQSNEQSELNLGYIADTTVTMIPTLLLDGSGIIGAGNSAWVALCQRYDPSSRDGFIGQPYATVCQIFLSSDDERQVCEDGIAGVLGGELHVFQHEYQTVQAGTPARLQMTLMPLVGRDGALASHLSLPSGSRNENRFEQLLESPMDALLVINQHGNVQMVNARAETLFGYGRDELIGTSMHQLLPERYRPRHTEHQRRYFEDPHARPMGTGLELFAQHKDGHEFPVEISLTPLTADHGRAVVAAIRDVSARQASAVALMAAQTRAQLALDVAQVGTWSWQPNTDEVTADARCREMCSFPPDAPLTLASIRKNIFVDDWERVETGLRQALTARLSTFAEELRIVQPDGNLSWVSARGQILPTGADGGLNLTSMLGTVVDITVRKRQERNAAIMTELAEALSLLTTPDMIYRAASETLTKHFSDVRLTLATVDEAADRVTGIYDSREPNLTGSLGTRRLSDFVGSTYLNEIKTGEPFVVEDVATDWRTAANAEVYSTSFVQAQLFVPLVKDGELTLIFGLQRAAPYTWPQDEINLVREFSEHLYLRIERAYAEEALREREARYRTLFESIDDGFCIIDVLFDHGQAVDYRFLEVNPTFAKQTGLADAVGKTARELVPNLEGRWIKTYAKVATTGQAANFVDNSDSMNRTFDVVAVKVGEPQGFKVAVLFTDITERLEAEQALRDNEQRMALHVQQTPLAVIEWQPAGGRISVWNPAAERIFGYRADEMTHLGHIGQLFLDDPELQRAFDVEGGGAARHAARNRTKDGRVILCEWYTTRLTSAEGKTSGMASLAMDVTSRQRAVEALLSAQDEERTRISRDLHDGVGQALTAISLGLKQVQEGGDLTQLSSVKTLVADTLEDVRRLSRDLRPALLDELGLEAAVARYARDLSARAMTEIDVLIRVPRQLPKNVEVAAFRVVQEALTNVARHARATQASVVMTANDERLHLVVEDNGVGFDTSSSSPANSLGLLGIRERIELLGGNLRLESTPQQGTILSVRLPLQPLT